MYICAMYIYVCLFGYIYTGNIYWLWAMNCNIYYVKQKINKYLREFEGNKL